MIYKPIVLVLGAGASVPFGFPTGIELTNEVFTQLEYQPKKIAGLPLNSVDETKSANNLVQMLLDFGFKKDYIEEFRQDLISSQLNSIDLFLERRTEFIEIGKLSIAYVLLKYEIPDRVMNQNSDWYRYIWNKLNTSYDNFEKNQLSIITFNYDRSLEYYLFNAFKAMFGKNNNECIEKLKAIKIIHLHGKLDELPYFTRRNGIKFGEMISDCQLLSQVSKQIKIIHEDISGNKDFENAFQLMNTAERVFFMGFGYGEKNIERLRIYDILPIGKGKMKGTVMGFTPNEIIELSRKTLGRIEFSERDCLSFLRNNTF